MNAETEKVSLGVRLPAAMYRRLKELTAEENIVEPYEPITMAVLIRRYIQDGIERTEAHLGKAKRTNREDSSASSMDRHRTTHSEATAPARAETPTPRERPATGNG